MNIVCLSSTGAAPRITLDLVKVLQIQRKTFKVFISKDNELIQQYTEILGPKELEVIYKKKNLLTAIINRLMGGRWILNSILIKKLDDHKIIFFPMATAWDYYLPKIIKKKFTIIRLIHDAKRHPGDKLPTNFMIGRQCHQSDLIICLSKFTSNALQRKYRTDANKHLVVEHPVISIVETAHTSTSMNPYCLLIGRNKKYQNFSNFIRIWENKAPENWNSALLAAGQGVSKHRYFERSKVTFLDKWLTESELVNLIANSNAVVLPYTEASQSGLIPIAKYFGKNIVLMPVGGLVEQLENYPGSWVARDVTDAMEIVLKEFPFKDIVKNEESWIKSWFKLVEVLGPSEHAKGDF